LPLIGLEHNPEPSVCETMRNLPGWHSDQPGPRQGRTDQRIEVIGAKPGWNAQRSSRCPVLEAPFRDAWYVAKARQSCATRSSGVAGSPRRRR
jgi:hypothetical protein